MKTKKIINFILTKGWKQFIIAIISRLHGRFKKITGYMFYKNSFIKYSVYQDLQHNINIPEANLKDLEIIRFASKVGILKDNIWSIIQAVNHINYNKIEGDFVECGVFEGRILIALKKLQQSFKLNNKLYGFDTFEGMTEPGEFDTYSENEKKASDTYFSYQDKNEKWMHGPLEKVKNNLQKYFTDISDINLIKGDVLQTLSSEQNLPKKISLLRLDTDLYDSTKKELEVLYPRLQSKGVLIIDDYGFFDGSRKAVDEYFQDKFVYKHYIDKNIRLIIKE
jgi:O-methyltransferase